MAEPIPISEALQKYEQRVLILTSCIENKQLASQSDKNLPQPSSQVSAAVQDVSEKKSLPNILLESEALLGKAILDVLVYRDTVQTSLDKAVSLSADDLLLVEKLDKTLKSYRKTILKTIELDEWRSLLNPPTTAWWWHLEPPALLPCLEKQRRWLDRWDWLWTFASFFFLSFAVTVVFDTLNRVVGEGLDTQGLFPVVIQVLLTIAGGSAALTKNGRNVLRTIMTRLRIPKHFWQEFSAIASLVLLLAVLWVHEQYLPDLATERYQAGIAHYEAGQFDSALQSYQQSIAIRPDFVEAHYSLGLIYEDLQQREKAIAEYQLVVSQDPEAMDKLTWLRSHNNLGRLYILEEKYRTAWIPLERAFNSITAEDLDSPEIETEYYNLLKNLGWMWLGQGKLIEADEFIAQAIDKNPKRAAAHCLNAQVLEGLEQKDEALISWASCLRGERKIQAEEAEWAATARERLEEDRP